MFEKKYLIIWQEIPETYRIYTHQCLSLEESRQIEKCHNQFINIETTADIDRALETLNSIIETAEPEDISLPLIIRDNYTMIVTGIIL